MSACTWISKDLKDSLRGPGKDGCKGRATTENDKINAQTVGARLPKSPLSWQCQVELWEWRSRGDHQHATPAWESGNYETPIGESCWALTPAKSYTWGLGNPTPTPSVSKMLESPVCTLLHFGSIKLVNFTGPQLERYLFQDKSSLESHPSLI